MRDDAKLQKLLLEKSSCLDAEPLGQLNKYFCTRVALEKERKYFHLLDPTDYQHRCKHCISDPIVGIVDETWQGNLFGTDYAVASLKLLLIAN